MYAMVEKNEQDEDSEEEPKKNYQKNNKTIDDQFSKIVKKEMIKDYMAEEHLDENVNALNSLRDSIINNSQSATSNNYRSKN